jgi:diacylglycerol O-acyltransferase/trehalose O-mycolyltransferase
MLDAGGFNVDCMWGPPWSPLWLRNDPFVFAPRLKAEGIRLFIASGPGIPSALDPDLRPFPMVAGMSLEFLADIQTRAFQIRLNSIGDTNVDYYFPPAGVHDWPYWAQDVRVMLPDLSAHVG